MPWTDNHTYALTEEENKKTDKIYGIALQRIVEKCLSENEKDSIWYTICGILCRDGEQAALEYIKNVPTKTGISRGGAGLAPNGCK